MTKIGLKGLFLSSHTLIFTRNAHVCTLHSLHIIIQDKNLFYSEFTFKLVLESQPQPVWHVVIKADAACNTRAGNKSQKSTVVQTGALNLNIIDKRHQWPLTEVAKCHGDCRPTQPDWLRCLQVNDMTMSHHIFSNSTHLLFTFHHTARCIIALQISEINVNINDNDLILLIDTIHISFIWQGWIKLCTLFTLSMPRCPLQKRSPTSVRVNKG